tara:strand:- start:4931 stop:5158 length:228 start_codon:yes stop_codon:yes gene_type:complete
MEDKKYFKVKDNPNLLREKDSKAIINTDNDSYNAYMNRKKHQSKKDRKIEKLEQEVQDLKNMILKLVEGGALNRK